MSRSPGIRVVAGVLSDAAGRVLVSQRLARQPMPGKWEFPGGKLESGETRLAGLARELGEELGVTLVAARPLIRYRHVYPQLEVELDIWKVQRFAGEPAGRLGQVLQWVAADELVKVDLLEADRPIVQALALPELYLVTGEPAAVPHEFLDRLDAALARGIRLVQLRAPDLDARAYGALAAAAVARCRSAGARLLLNREPAEASRLARMLGADGIHVPARHIGTLPACTGPDLLIGASCHDRQELADAREAGAGFAVLGPVCPTRSHPERQSLGWLSFEALIRDAGLPVYALGGLRADDLPRAWAAGAQGVAAIRGLWTC
jgi:8-oxo-dGTP diphosphatase